MLFKLEKNLVTIEYGPHGVVIKGYLEDDYNNAYRGLMGDSANVYSKEIEDYTEYTFKCVLFVVEELIKDMGYDKYSYDVRKKSCQNFVHSLSEDLVNSVEFSWDYPLEYNCKVIGFIQNLMGLNNFKFVPNKFFPNPIPKWLAYSNHSLAQQKKILLDDGISFEEKHFEEFMINID